MRILTIGRIVGPLLMLLPGAALAEEPSGGSLRGSEAISSRPIAASIEASPFSVLPIEDGTLKSIAGREDVTQVSQAEQVAGVSRNSVGDNSVTGDARIADNAFQNMSGLSILNVNTGNNVAINAAMNVNVSINSGQ